MMTFDEYQSEAASTAVYPGIGNNFVYPTLGLTGEAGEVAEKIKKIIRDKNGKIDSESRESLSKELGDVLWYIAALCCELNLSMGDVATTNLSKLASREKRNVVQGSGDNR